MKHVGTGKDMIRVSPFVYRLFLQSSCIPDAKRLILKKKKSHIHRIKEHNSWNVSKLEPQEPVCLRKLRKNKSNVFKFM